MVPDKSDTRVTDLITALINMDRLKIREILNPEDGTVIKEQTIDTIIVPALDEIGKRWEQGTIAISQVYMAGVLIEEMISSIIPDLEPNRINHKKMATVVLEDYHMSYNFV